MVSTAKSLKPHLMSCLCFLFAGGLFVLLGLTGARNQVFFNWALGFLFLTNATLQFHLYRRAQQRA
jgi:hypothetical protein